MHPEDTSKRGRTPSRKRGTGALQVIDNENRTKDFRFHYVRMLRVGEYRTAVVTRPMRRIKFLITYDGTDYHGWQVQPGLPTIQGALEDVLSGIEGRRVLVTTSGRTDAGVHALAQVAAFDLANPIPYANLRRAMNRL